MNLLGRKKSGLIILLALFLFGCDDPNEIGLELRADSDRIGVFYEELILPTTIIQNDSLLTSSSPRLLVGHEVSDEFGVTTAKGYTQFSFGQNVKDIPPEAVYDSVLLLLMNDYNYGQGIYEAQEFSVHELAEDLSDSGYFSFDEASYNLDPIGQQTFLLPDFVNIEEPDSILEIQLTDDFGTRLFDAVKDTTIVKNGDNAQLHKLFKGFALVSSTNNNIISRFDPNIDRSALILYYHVDTIAQSYDFGLYNGENFNQISVDRAGTQLENIKDLYYQDFYPENKNAYLQAGTGLITKVDLSPLISYFDTLKDVSINRAEIELLINPPGLNQLPPSFILMYYAGENNKRLKIGSEYLGLVREGTTDLFNLEYSSSTQTYRAPMTIYADNLRRGITDLDHLLIYPFEFGYFNSLNRFQISPENIKIKIYYTKLK